jgi:GxxExxY protein
MNVSRKDVDDLSYEIIGCAIDVHKELGPGLMESIYHTCLEREFQLNEIEYKSQLVIPVEYKGVLTEAVYRLDFLVENLIVVVLKAIEYIIPVHKSQLLSYMELLKKPKGILINFNCMNLFKEGQQTFVNKYYSELSPM